jgi:anaerobic selenocysteine-containing dehydrogenase
VLIDTLSSVLTDAADVVLPGATWVEKAGTFENARGVLQAFEQAIPVIEMAKSEGQIALDLLAVLAGRARRDAPVETVLTPAAPGRLPDAVAVAPALGAPFDAAAIRREMSASGAALGAFGSIAPASARSEAAPDMQVIEL